MLYTIEDVLHDTTGPTAVVIRCPWLGRAFQVSSLRVTCLVPDAFADAEPIPNLRANLVDSHGMILAPQATHSVVGVRSSAWGICSRSRV